MKVGLVLEGGAMRGLFTAGVLDTLLEEKIKIDTIVAVSAGALFGVNFPSKQKGRALRYNKRFIHDKRYISWQSLLTTGNVVNKEFAFYQVPFEFDPFDNSAFKEANIDFYATLTNVETGLAEHIKITDPFAQMETLRASSAMPYVSQTIEIKGNKYLDGGIADSIPVEFCQTLGIDKIIVVLTRPLDYQKTATNPLIPKLFYRKYPNLVKALQNRHLIYNQQLANIMAQSKQNQIFVIRPSQDLGLKRLEKDQEKLQSMYNLGITETQDALPLLRKYLEG